LETKTTDGRTVMEPGVSWGRMEEVFPWAKAPWLTAERRTSQPSVFCLPWAASHCKIPDDLVHLTKMRCGGN
jgi:hypothetical protein